MKQKKDFINRCIPIVIDDGTAKDSKQAVAICYSIWETKKTKELSDADKKLTKLLLDN